MRNLLTVLLITIPFITWAEGAHFVADADTIYKTIQPKGYAELDLDIKGLGDDTVRLTWEVIARKENKKWDLSICDFGACYVGVPEGGSMAPADKNDDVFMKFSVNPMGEADVCWYTLRLYVPGKEDEADTVTLKFNTQPVSVGEVNKVKLQYYPNPTSDYLTVSSTQFNIQSISIVNLLGKQVIYLEKINKLSSAQSIDVSALKKGSYVLVVVGEGQKLSTRFIKN